MEKFNRQMLDQFTEFQKRHSSNYLKWQKERQRQELLAIEKWRRQSQEHEKQMLETFSSTIAQCNAAMSTVLKAKHVAEQEVQRLKEILEDKDKIKTELVLSSTNDV